MDRIFAVNWSAKGTRKLLLVFVALFLLAKSPPSSSSWPIDTHGVCVCVVCATTECWECAGNLIWRVLSIEFFGLNKFGQDNRRWRQWLRSKRMMAGGGALVATTAGWCRNDFYLILCNLQFNSNELNGNKFIYDLFAIAFAVNSFFFWWLTWRLNERFPEQFVYQLLLFILKFSETICAVLVKASSPICNPLGEFINVVWKQM